MKNIESHYFASLTVVFASTLSVVGLLISTGLDKHAIDGLDGLRPDILAGFVAVVISAFAAAVSLFMQRRLKSKRVRRRIFIVYARADAKAAIQISELLRLGGFDPWLDTEQLLPGQLWKEEIDLALEDSGAAVILMSKNLVASEFAQHELLGALKKLHTSSNRITPIVPIRLDDVEVPSSLAGIQWVKLNSDGVEERLLRALELATTEPTRTPSHPTKS